MKKIWSSTQIGLAAGLAAALVTLACASLDRNRPDPAGTPSMGSATVPETADPGEVPVGQELDVRLRSRLSSDTASIEDRFEATTLVDLRQGANVLIPAGSLVRGTVNAVTRAGRLERTGSLALNFDEINIQGRGYPIHAMASDVYRSGGYEEDAARIGAGAAIGGVVGGILGGVRGALAGVLVGGGGVIAATEGEDVVLPAGAIIRLRFDSSLHM